MFHRCDKIYRVANNKMKTIWRDFSDQFSGLFHEYFIYIGGYIQGKALTVHRVGTDLRPSHLQRLPNN